MKKSLKKDRSDYIAYFDKTDFGDLMSIAKMKKNNLQFKEVDKSVMLKVPEHLLNTIKKTAKKQGVQYQRLMRLVLEKGISFYL